MRKLILSLTVFMAAIQSLAFDDNLTLQATNEVITRMQQEDDMSRRLALLNTYKDFLYNRLNTIEIPDLDSTPDTDPRLDEYRSLTEFDGYVNLINMRQVTNQSCVRTKTHIERSTSRDGGLVPEAVEALRILSALCR